MFATAFDASKKKDESVVKGNPRVKEKIDQNRLRITLQLNEESLLQNSAKAFR